MVSDLVLLANFLLDWASQSNKKGLWDHHEKIITTLPTWKGLAYSLS